MRVCVMFFAIAAILSATPSLADRLSPAWNPGSLTVSSVTTIADAKPQLVNGFEVSTSAFPASFYAAFDEPQGYPSCTVTFIGPRVVLTAAHCVGHKMPIYIKDRSAIISGECFHYVDTDEADESADFAVCQMRRAIPGLKAERVTSVSAKKGSAIMLAGYGCTDSNLNRGQAGKFHAGLALVVQTVGYDRGLPNYFVSDGSRDGGARASLCPGDSGGAVYCLGDQKNPFGKRSVCGINSSVECSARRGQTCVEVGAQSYLASIGRVMEWLKTDGKYPICGLDPSIDAHCRD